MVKHPKYQAMDDARESEIPRAFKNFANDNYELKRLEPKRDSEPRLGPIPRPTFHIFDKTRKKIDQFHPNGFSEYYDETFRPIYEKMVKQIEQAAETALHNFEQRECGGPAPRFEPGFPE